jgi:hypothetical protein
MSECDLEVSITKRSWPSRGWRATERNSVSQIHQSKLDVGAYSLNNSQLRYLFVKKYSSKRVSININKIWYTNKTFVLPNQ